MYGLREFGNLPPGTVISVQNLFYRHVGILGGLTMFGERVVISFSNERNGYTEEPMSKFSKGREIKVHSTYGKLAPWQVLSRAKQWQGFSYSWIKRNCEHFVRHAHGLPVESPQVQLATVAGGMLLCALGVAGRT